MTAFKDLTDIIRRADYRGHKMCSTNPHLFWYVEGITGTFTGQSEAELAVDAKIAAEQMKKLKADKAA